MAIGRQGSVSGGGIGSVGNYRTFEEERAIAVNICCLSTSVVESVSIEVVGE